MRIVDYGVGNLHSVRRAFQGSGAIVEIASPKTLDDVGALVLPGVGAFGPAAERLAPHRDVLLRYLEEGRPALGICLGMQLFFQSSEESPGEGIGFIRGGVRRLAHPRLPQIGWNDLDVEDDPLFDGLDRPEVYFVNSYAPEPEEPVTIARATYGTPFAAAVRKLNTYGVQFHPEKSSSAGLRMLRNFLGLAEAAC